MQMLYNNNLINEIVDKLFKHRKSDYSEYYIDNIVYMADLQHSILKIPNQNYQQLCLSIFNKAHHITNYCILFLHGYGSNRMECANLLRSLKDDQTLCAFDFSGSGKSQGDLITYGQKEKQDINSVINHLRSMGFKKFVLWGRSMGATSSLLYCMKYKPKDVLLQIIDSPFYSFQMIAKEIANKNVKAPQFVISIALQLAKKNCQKFHYNPFQIELVDVGGCQIPALFVYSEEDSVINSKNVALIIDKYKAKYQKLIIEENHNAIRNKNTVQKIFSFIQKYTNKEKIHFQKVRQSATNNYDHHHHQTPFSLSFNMKTPALNFNMKSPALSFNMKSPAQLYGSRISNVKRHDVSTENINKKHFESSDKFSPCKKGIERVNLEEKQRLEEKQKKHDDYGIWTSSKNKPQTEKKITKNKKGHLSLSISMADRTVKKEPQAVAHLHLLNMNSTSDSSDNIYHHPILNRNQNSEKGKRKIQMLKSMTVSRCLNHSKYL